MTYFIVFQIYGLNGTLLAVVAFCMFYIQNKIGVAGAMFLLAMMFADFNIWVVSVNTIVWLAYMLHLIKMTVRVIIAQTDQRNEADIPTEIQF